MPFCKKCGTLYTKALGICPKCNEEAVLAAQAPPEALPPAQKKEQVRKSWVGICIALPALIAFIYLLYYATRALQS